MGLSWTAVAAAALLHLLMDCLQADAVSLLWPFSPRRLSLDVSPAIDPWLIVVLASAILFPELLRLVGDEIGSHSKRPRGRTGSVIGLSVALIYLGTRTLFHANVTAALESRAISGEMPRRFAAFPDSVSPFLWHGVVETESALHLSTMRSMGGEVSYASSITTLRKPEPSPVLSAAQTSAAAVEFLKTARFPKAIVEQETQGSSLKINDLKDQAMQTSNHAIFADITLDKSAKVISSELQWQKISTDLSRQAHILSGSRPLPQNPPRSQITQCHKNQQKNHHLDFVLRQKRQGIISIFHGQIPHAKIPDQPGQRNRRKVTYQRHFKHSCRKHKQLERGRRRQKCCDQHSAKSIPLHPMSDHVRARSRFPPEIGFSAFARNKIQQHASQDRSQRSHQRIQWHARGMLNRQFNQQQIIDYRKSENRRIQKRNQK
jgi:hypothetical protein